MPQQPTAQHGHHTTPPGNPSCPGPTQHTQMFPTTLIFKQNGRSQSPITTMPSLQHDYKAATTTPVPDPPRAPTDVGRCTFEPRPCYKVPLFGMYSQRHKSRSALLVHQMLWMGAREMFCNLKCSPVSEIK